jgi:hypothetical protein
MVRIDAATAMTAFLAPRRAQTLAALGGERLGCSRTALIEALTGRKCCANRTMVFADPHPFRLRSAPST